VSRKKKRKQKKTAPKGMPTANYVKYGGKAISDAESIDDGGWNKTNPYKWHRYIGADKMDYWPANRSAFYRGLMHRKVKVYELIAQLEQSVLV